ncbi:MAG: hypothetical protein ABI222_17600, partial [Opitutaceae bacterium]
MNRDRRVFFDLRFIFRLSFGLLAIALSLSATTWAAESDSELKLVMIVTRHGVRSPLQTNETLGRYAAEPWPDWHITPGIQTVHGRQQMTL